MSGYTKLFNSILASTVWSEPVETRIVWITLLAMADKHGVAEGSVPGLAVFARLPIEAVRTALKRLSSPDRDSRSQEHEGRRIESVDGGWLILNHAKYRAKLGVDERREYNRLKQRQHRAKRQQKSLTVNHSNRSNHKAEAEAEAEAGKDSRAPALGFEDFWKLYPKKRAKLEALKAWNKQKMTPEDVVAILEAVQLQAQCIDWRKEGGQFIPYPATYINQRRWTDQIVQEDFYRARL